MEWLPGNSTIQEGDIITRTIHIQNRGKDMYMMTAVVGEVALCKSRSAFLLAWIYKWSTLFV